MLQLAAAFGGQAKLSTRAFVCASAALIVNALVTRAVRSSSKPFVDTSPALTRRVTMTPLTRSGTLAW